MKRRILQIIPTLDRSGAEKQMSLLARRLPADQFDVHVCALTRGGPLLECLREAGLPVTVIGKRWRVDPRAYYRLKRLVADLRPDLIHTWLFAANSYGRAAGLACGVKCLVAGERCVDPWKGWAEFSIDRRLARHTARIVANSSGVRDFYVTHKLPADKIEVIPNGIDLPQPSDTTRGQLLDELQLPHDSLLIGLVGRLWPQKRVKDAIWATDLLKTVRNRVHLLIIGDGPHRGRLERFRNQAELVGRVHFLGHRSDVPRLMPHFDALWSTSAHEGQSNAIMEAMAAAVPVVATDIAGTRDLIVPGVTGYLVPPGDRAGIARHTNRILGDRDLAQRLGQAAQQRMAAEFSVQQMVARYAALYTELLEAEI